MLCSNCRETVLPVVAIDIDGTLADYHNHLLDFAVGYFDREFPRDWDGTGDWEEHLGLTRSEYREMKLAFRQGGQKRNMPIFPGAMESMQAIHSMPVELWITTTRPWMRHDSTDPDTREWLRRNMIPYDRLLYDDNKYQRLAELVGKERVILVVDDLPAQLRSAQWVFEDGVVYKKHGPHNMYANMPGFAEWDPVNIRGIVVNRIDKWRKQNENSS